MTEKSDSRKRKPDTDGFQESFLARPAGIETVRVVKDDFPQIWVRNWENRDLRKLLWHRHRMNRHGRDDESVASPGIERRRTPSCGLSGKRIGFSVASRSRAIWDRRRWRSTMSTSRKRNREFACFREMPQIRGAMLQQQPVGHCQYTSSIQRCGRSLVRPSGVKASALLT